MFLSYKSQGAVKMLLNCRRHYKRTKNAYSVWLIITQKERRDGILIQPLHFKARVPSEFLVCGPRGAAASAFGNVILYHKPKNVE
jgi:hypothetical protein